jgi:tyrosyl-tRNA synthetase
VALRADIEIGGTEQLFNLMAGRTLQQAFGQAPQAVITCPLLLGTDGQKMSKSTDNCIYLDEPAKEMYGKLMSITDEQILPYFELCTDVPLTDLEDLRQEMDRGINPMIVKKRLAYEVTLLYHPRTQALKAQQAFEQEVQRREVPDDIPEQVLPAQSDPALPDFLLALGLVTSKSEARRLAAQHGIRLDGEVVEDTGPVTLRNGMVVQVGKRKFARVRLHP